MKTSYFLIAVAFAGLGIHSAARAEAPRQQAVPYHDLDLTQFEGAKELYTRIASAARDVCGKLSPWPVDQTAIVRHCRQEATARAVVDVNEPALTNYYAARRGVSPESIVATVKASRVAGP